MNRFLKFVFPLMIGFILIDLSIASCNKKENAFPINIENGEDERLGISNFIIRGEITKRLNSETPEPKYKCENCINNWAFIKDSKDTFRIRRVYLSQLGWNDENALETFALQFKTTKCDTLKDGVFAYHIKDNFIITDKKNFVIHFHRYNSEKTVINYSEVFGNAPNNWENLSSIYSIK
jgi:hypothetical protein